MNTFPNVETTTFIYSMTPAGFSKESWGFSALLSSNIDFFYKDLRRIKHVKLALRFLLRSNNTILKVTIPVKHTSHNQGHMVPPFSVGYIKGWKRSLVLLLCLQGIRELSLESDIAHSIKAFRHAHVLLTCSYKSNLCNIVTRRLLLFFKRTAKT